MAIADPGEVRECCCPCGDPLMPPPEELLAPSLRLARDGRLKHAEAAEIASGRLARRLMPGAHFRDAHHAATLSRALYQQAVSWAIFGEEWLDALARLLISLSSVADTPLEPSATNVGRVV